MKVSRISSQEVFLKSNTISCELDENIDNMKRSCEWAVAIDDGYFPFHYKSGKGSAPLIAVLGCREVIKDVSITLIQVDEKDPDKHVIALIKDLVERNSDINISSIMSDSVIFAGFSVYDPWLVYEYFKIPIIALFSHPLDLLRIRSALKSHFIDHERRFALIERAYLNSIRIKTLRGVLRVLCIGFSVERCRENIMYNQTFHKYPQPLNSADIIASALGRFLANKSFFKKIDLG
jgi:endonuclease V-like protein UPF0215 family